MSPHDFWYEDPSWLWTYITNKEVENKEYLNRLNYDKWIEGIYMTRAIAACLDKKNKYPKEPLDLGLDDEKTKKKKQEKKNIDAFNKLSLWASAFKGNKEKGH